MPCAPSEISKNAAPPNATNLLALATHKPHFFSKHKPHTLKTLWTKIGHQSHFAQKGHRNKNCSPFYTGELSADEQLANNFIHKGTHLDHQSDLEIGIRQKRKEKKEGCIKGTGAGHLATWSGERKTGHTPPCAVCWSDRPVTVRAARRPRRGQCSTGRGSRGAPAAGRLTLI